MKDLKIQREQYEALKAAYRQDEQITVEIGSQEDVDFWRTFKQKYPRVDILLDDGGHTMNQQITTFREMFPHIKDGGLYMCEDTFIEFAKNLVDELNAFHTRGALSPTYNTLNMGGLHFYDSIVVAEKKHIPFEPLNLTVGKPVVSNFSSGL